MDDSVVKPKSHEHHTRWAPLRWLFCPISLSFLMAQKSCSCPKATTQLKFLLPIYQPIKKFEIPKNKARIISFFTFMHKLRDTVKFHLNKPLKHVDSDIHISLHICIYT